MASVFASSTTDTTHYVAYTTEILENVLAHLPMDDLLRAKRVCQKWKAVIESSHTLRRIVFVEADTRGQECPHDGRHKPHGDASCPASYEIERNPMLEQYLDPKEVGFPGLLGYPRYKYKWLKRVPCSWLDMFLTQPPTAAADLVTVAIPIRSLPGQLWTNTRNTSYIEKISGITFRSLLDEIERVLDDEGLTQRARVNLTDDIQFSIRLSRPLTERDVS